MGSTAKQTGLNKPTALDTAFISPFLGATKKVLTTMANVDVVVQPPIKGKGSLPQGDVAGIMPMSTPSIRGQLIVSFQAQAILRIVSNMLMEEFTELDEAVVDCVGEITNMITGAAKALVEEKYNFNMASPKAYVRDQFDQIALDAPIQIIIPYKTEAGVFCVELGFVPI